MDLSKFTDEELEYLTNSQNFIKEELIKRKKIIEREIFIIHTDDCFIDNNFQNCKVIYKITGIDNDEIFFEEIIINNNQMTSDEDCSVYKTEQNFHKMKKIPLHIFEEVKNKCEEYNDEVERLHDKLYSACNGLVENYG